MSLDDLVLRIRTEAAAHQEQAPASGSVDFEALAEELEALGAIFTTELPHHGIARGAAVDHPDDRAETAGADAVPGGIHVSQIEPSMGKEAGAKADEVAQWSPGSKIRLLLVTSFQTQSTVPEPEEVPIRLSITIPSSYPANASTNSSSFAEPNKPPQLQLLNRFVGPYPVDPSLFGSILRTFLHYDPAIGPAVPDATNTTPSSNSSLRPETELASSPSDERPLTPRYDQAQTRLNGVRWHPGEPVLYEGIEFVRELVTDWYNQRSQRDRERTEARGHRADADPPSVNDTALPPDVEEKQQSFTDAAPSRPLQTAKQHPILQRLVRTEPITERKSVFVAHAARLDHPDEVSIVLSHILSDRKIARATHPIIHAWVCTTHEVVHRDHDDDGETAAGGRLAHLLDLLGLPNALVVVTRWYGGILLGADRFKFINRVARAGLEQAKLIES